MKAITQQQFDEILMKHMKWLKGDSGGERGHIENKNLNRLDLFGAHLDRFEFYSCSFDEATFSVASFQHSLLMDCDFFGADFRNADFRCATICNCDFRFADLRNGNFAGTNIVGDRNIFSNSNLAGATGHYFNKHIPLACPEYGSFIGWKKALHKNLDDTVLVKLQIPEDAKRSSATGRKCRASKAIVLDVCSLSDDNKKYTYAVSNFDLEFVYEVGKTVEVDDFCEDRFNECAPGIHFFITKQEAINY